MAKGSCGNDACTNRFFFFFFLGTKGFVGYLCRKYTNKHHLIILMINKHENDDRTLSFNGLLNKFVNASHLSLNSSSLSSSSSSSSSPPPPPPPPSSSTTTANSAHTDQLPSSRQSSPHNKKKRKRPQRQYAPPSTYAHLSPIRDSIDYELICLFVGLNPGIATAQKGHAFAGPTNLFWPLLFESGCVTSKLSFKDDSSLPSKWQLGITNLVSRPTAEQSELSKQEMIDSSESLEIKIATFRPISICIVGKGIWESIYRFKTGKILPQASFTYGWQSPPFDFAQPIMMNVKSENHVMQSQHQLPRIFVVPSTSGRVAAYSRAMKSELWAELGSFINSERKKKKKKLLYNIRA
ncbi:uracil-DNA glycosylase-like protein [Lipomyces japonicus]|uniref:uracil-DNA glycosylase-like protein n=1 Tax=Lipomyces japonicus TaxID=56871 RepID=UPI0034CE6608